MSFVNPVVLETIHAPGSTRARRKAIAKALECGGIRFTFAVQNAGRFSASAAMKGEKLNLRIKNLER